MTTNPLPPDPYTLTPYVVQTLRDSLRYRASNGLDPVLASDTPYVIWLESERAYLLRQAGRPWALSADPAPLLACLRAERAEPGFIARIIDTATPCDVASLAPDLARASPRAGEAEAAAARAAVAARLTAKTSTPTRRTDVSKINLEDLL